MTLDYQSAVEAGIAYPNKSGFISAEQMQSIPAVSQAINNWCILASMPCKAYEDDGDVREETDSYLSKVINDEPNEWMNGISHWRAFIRNMAVHGFGVAKIYRYENGMVQGMLLWPSHAFQVTRNPLTWEPEFRANGIVQDPMDWFYVPWETLDGITPVPQYIRYADALSFAKSIDTYSASYFINNAFPSGVLKSAATLTEEKQKELLEGWYRQTAGAKNAGKVRILQGALDYQTVQNTPEEAMLKDARSSAVQVISQMFNISPVFLGNQESLTTSAALVPLFQHLSMITLLPIARKLEAEIKRKLIMSKDRNLFFEWSFDSLLRGTVKDRFASYALGLANQAFLDVDTVRSWEHLPPMPEQPEPPTVNPFDVPQLLGSQEDTSEQEELQNAAR